MKTLIDNCKHLSLLQIVTEDKTFDYLVLPIERLHRSDVELLDKLISRIAEANNTGYPC